VRLFDRRRYCCSAAPSESGSLVDSQKEEKIERLLAGASRCIGREFVVDGITASKNIVLVGERVIGSLSLLFSWTLFEVPEIGDFGHCRLPGVGSEAWAENGWSMSGVTLLNHGGDDNDDDRNGPLLFSMVFREARCRECCCDVRITFRKVLYAVVSNPVEIRLVVSGITAS
jgi:hypothetical protein